MNYSLLISVAGAVIAASAFVVAWLNYRTGRKMPNENKLFEEKIRSYQSVIKALNEAAAVYIECANEFHELKGSGSSVRKAKDELNGLLVEGYYKMEDAVYEQSLLLPNEILDSIHDYFELFDLEDFLNETAEPEKIDQFEERLNDSFDEVINAMHEDLAFEKLDVGLKKRIGGRSAVKRRRASDTPT